MRRLRLILAIAVLGTTLAVPATASASHTPTHVDSLQNIPITGTIPALGELATFTGDLDINRFAVRNGQLVAIGDVTGTLTNAAGAVVGTVTDFPVQLPIDLGATDAACDILHLVLGPLDLNLLGLVVHLDQIVLDITAEPGPGNLLGNLLCAVAGLLDGGLGGALNGVAALLNRILAILG